ncbi:unnamed protein product [Rangifer tarandus platyrhynchus]|uniref:Uncharacterized protein n=2 Tax=Rangifer tarandus platyrhynchus TaxID=3082113 RepID=A0AC60A7V1_RANTA|nr:unnamed protein product [Rangifer tarandus platyrhynchus]
MCPVGRQKMMVHHFLWCRKKGINLGPKSLRRWGGGGGIQSSVQVLTLDESESVSCSVVSYSLQPYGPHSPPGSSIHGILQARILDRLPFPSPGNLPDAVIEPRFPMLLADSLPSELPASSVPQWFSE